MTEPTREQLIERITEAIEKAAADAGNEAIVELDAMSEYWSLGGVYADDAKALAEVAYGPIQVALSNAHYWRDLAREQRDAAQREKRAADERARQRSQTISELHERIRKVRQELLDCAEASDGMCGYGQRALAVLDGEGEEKP